jgi:hypothetical protein
MSDMNRRKHVRLEMTEHAVAIDPQGREIGHVSQAGGGGVTIEAPSEQEASKFEIGERLRITILEPGTQTKNTIDMVLRRRVGKELGFEFVTGNPAS